ncbi:MAG: cupin domain-containing protein [Candidatus Limnocylindrales bacterium]|jgi:quercetin dioxygenase-like cupin family protein
MIKRVTRKEAEIYPLPGRDWFQYIGPENSPAQRVTVGVSIFPPGSRPPGHVHEAAEETVYVVSGRGRLVTAEATADLEPGVAVWIPVGVHHATESDGPEPLEMVCAFSPPIVPGGYERGSRGKGD